VVAALVYSNLCYLSSLSSYTGKMLIIHYIGQRQPTAPLFILLVIARVGDGSLRGFSSTRLSGGAKWEQSGVC